jgi:hypothetical protein
VDAPALLFGDFNGAVYGLWAEYRSKEVALHEGAEEEGWYVGIGCVGYHVDDVNRHLCWKLSGDRVPHDSRRRLRYYRMLLRAAKHVQRFLPKQVRLRVHGTFDRGEPKGVLAAMRRLERRRKAA